MSETYEPELGQMVFGNAYAELDLGAAEGLVANELYALSETLGRRDPEAQAHGFLGGEWGYGQDFSCDTFKMHPYWWGDCTCGYASAEEAWAEANPHATDCWQERWQAEHERLHELKLGWEEDRAKMEAWETANGWDGRPGVAVFCDCGVDVVWLAWSADHSHQPDCGVVRPNFRCGDVEVRWYKYIGRGMSVNRAVSRDEWRAIFRRCSDALKSEAAS